MRREKTTQTRGQQPELQGSEVTVKNRSRDQRDRTGGTQQNPSPTIHHPRIPFNIKQT